MFPRSSASADGTTNNLPELNGNGGGSALLTLAATVAHVHLLRAVTSASRSSGASTLVIPAATMTSWRIPSTSNCPLRYVPMAAAFQSLTLPYVISPILATMQFNNKLDNLPPKKRHHSPMHSHTATRESNPFARDSWNAPGGEFDPRASVPSPLPCPLATSLARPSPLRMFRCQRLPGLRHS